MRIAGLCAVVLLVGCTNVSQMQRRYEAGDERQLARLMEIAARPDYPYATRRKAARALGEIGDPRAVPVLTSMLVYDFDQRVTLKQEALLALSRLGDRAAVPAIGRMLDLQLYAAGADLRLAALDALGQLGGAEAAGILVNALRYYDVMLLRQEQMAYRGVFSGEQMSPYGYGPMAPDSTGGRLPGSPRAGVFGEAEGMGGVSMFGTPLDFPLETRSTLDEERTAARTALVRVGPEAMPVIERFLLETETTQSLRRELGQVAVDISGTAAADSAAADSSAAGTVP